VSRPAALLAAGWALIALAVALAFPPFSGTDEDSHFARAASIGAGTIVGPPAPQGVPGLPAVQRELVAQLSRRVPVPDGLAAPSAACWILDARIPAGCLAETERQARGRRSAVIANGTYNPVPYLPAAAATLVADGPSAADRLARVAGALIPLALLAFAVAALGQGARSRLWLLGPLLAVTPAAFTVIAAVNPSGWEIAGAVAWGAGLLRGTRPGAPAPDWVWGVAAAGGLVLALAKTTGPLWLVLIAGFVLAASEARRLPRRLPRGPALAASAAVLGVISNRAWEAAYGAHTPFATDGLGGALRTGAQQWLHAADELVGAWGYLELQPPAWLVAGWALLAVAAVALAAQRATHRERLTLAAAVVAAAVVPIALYAAVIRPTGFGLQGRYVLPLVALVPLLAGELLARRPDPAAQAHTRLLAPAAALAGALQFGAFYVYARRSAVGTDGATWFVPDAAYIPPGGWFLWLAVAAAGAAAIAGAGLRAGEATPRPPGPEAST